MYGIFTNIYPINEPNVGTVNIPYMEHMGIIFPHFLVINRPGISP